MPAQRVQKRCGNPVALKFRRQGSGVAEERENISLGKEAAEGLENPLSAPVVHQPVMHERDAHVPSLQREMPSKCLRLLFLRL